MDDEPPSDVAAAEQHDGSEAAIGTIPQADRLYKVRELVAYWAGEPDGVAGARQALSLEPRDYGYYAQAASLLGFIERGARGHATVTERGERLLECEPESDAEKELFRRAIECAPALRPLRGYLRGDADLSREQLKGIIAGTPGVSGSTVPRRAGAMRSWRNYLALEPAPLPPSAGQLGLFEELGLDRVAAQWPPLERFPHNYHGRTVAEVVYGDLLGSRDALLVAGYASIGEILHLVSQSVDEGPQKMRIIFGAEPFPTKRARFNLGRNRFSDEVRDYWLQQGVSLRLSAAIIRAKELLAAGRLEVRLQAGSQELHAKIYVGDGAATLGSSNFTDPGLRRKREANARFRRHGEPKRHEELRSIAEICWQGGADFTAEFQVLLDELLQKVSWEHALGRACAELLEGRWAQLPYHLPDNWDVVAPLWPCQAQGVAQALWILENVGSVLVADATGSGKTRMGAHLVGATRRHLLAHGRATATDPLISCPPDAVLEKWRDELSRCGMTAITPFSHGILSMTSSPEHKRAERAIQLAPVIVIDEAHNFLNPASNRTRAILGNMADHKVLLTATPISRRPSDLLGIVDLLGADNFDDDALDLFESLLGKRKRINAELSEPEREEIRLEFAKFTVRRTRAMLNAAVAREPEKYRNDEGKPCRYPQMKPFYYRCAEPAEYRRVAGEVRDRASALRGLLYLKGGLELPQALSDDGWDERRYVEMRIRGAGGLARYHVMATFRSSRAALYEHVRGTAAAVERFRLERLLKSDSGNVVSDVAALAEQRPEYRVTCELPSWLRGKEFLAAVEEEVRIYEEIADKVAGLPSVREDAKARHLAGLSETNDTILAFDSRPITLADLRERLQPMTDAVVEIAAGGDVTGRRRVMRKLSRTSKGGRSVALCSDAMAEGFNLQGASVVVHLDMPAVVRIAEQRTGRVDRMDSPHDMIEAYWPKDPPEIALRGDERLVANNAFIADVMGANLVLPDEEPRLDIVVEPEEVVAELEYHETEWDEDAFSPVRSIVEGPSRLVSSDVYEEVKDSRARIVSAVSVVRSTRPWAFFAVGSGEPGAEIPGDPSRGSAPRWVYLDSPTARPETSLHAVAGRLRSHLGSETVDADFDDHVADHLAAFLEHLQASERKLLPRLKQRALDQMEHIIRAYVEDTPETDDERHHALRELVDLTRPNSGYDLASVASCWLEAIRPVRYIWLQMRMRRRGFARLRQLDSDLRKEPLSTESLREAFSHLRGSRPLDERIVAVILGVPGLQAGRDEDLQED